LAREIDVEALRTAYTNGGEFFSVHYASQSFVSVQKEPIAVAGIAVYNPRENVTQTFNRLDVVDREQAEMEILRRFFDFLSANRDATFLHWNMGSVEYGFEVLAKRYEFLGSKKPALTAPRERVDVDKVIRQLYGHDYAPHPRLPGIARLNDLDMRGFMAGADEAEAFTEDNWGDVTRSAATKAKLISDLFETVLARTLRTNNSAGYVKFAGSQLDAVATVLTLGERFLYVQRALANRKPSSRPSIEFADEADDQYLLRALLTQFFDDIRREDYVPSVAGGNSRVDFLLPKHGLVVELKHTRAGLGAKELGEELIVDRERYKANQRATHLIALVFDHEGLIDNPRGIEDDLQRDIGQAELAVTVRIFDR